MTGDSCFCRSGTWRWRCVFRHTPVEPAPWTGVDELGPAALPVHVSPSGKTGRGRRAEDAPGPGRVSGASGRSDRSRRGRRFLEHSRSDADAARRPPAPLPATPALHPAGPPDVRPRPDSPRRSATWGRAVALPLERRWQVSFETARKAPRGLRSGGGPAASGASRQDAVPEEGTGPRPGDAVPAVS